jgi:hypothetical protein
MPDGMSFDFSDLTALTADLGRVPDVAGPLIKKAIQVTATNVKKDWQASAKEHVVAGHARAYPYSVDYDITVDRDGVTAEVGPNLGKAQGALGIVEDAPGGVRGKPQNNARKALAANQDDFQKGLGIAIRDAYEKAVR